MFFAGAQLYNACQLLIKPSPMTCQPAFVARIGAFIDSFTELTGKLIAWLTLLLMLVTCVVVVMRYFLSTGSIALQESITYLHAALFMLGAAFTLQQGGHVRVDIFYRRLGYRLRAVVDIAGGLLFLMPLCISMAWLCWDYVLNSWSIREISSEGTGLPFIYLLKSLLLIMPLTLLLQGIAEIIRNILVLANGGNADIDEQGKTA